MRVYMRMGRGGGISVGPIGLLILAPFYLGYIFVVAMFYFVWLLLRAALVVGVLLFGAASALAGWLQERRATTPASAVPNRQTPTRHLTGLELRLAAERERQERFAREREVRLDRERAN